MRKIIRDFKNNQSGAVAMIVALAMAAIIGMLLLTVDLGEQQSQKFNTQGAADASALVAAQIISELRIKNGNNNNPSTTDILPKVLDSFKSNATVAGDNDKMASLDPASVQVTYLSSTASAIPDQVRVDGCFIVNDRFNVVHPQDGQTQHRVCSYAVASLAVFGHAEVVFALDVSPSMNQTLPGSSKRKIEQLQDAVNLTINDLVGAYGTGSDVLPQTYWGVVPFRGMVDLGTSYSNFVVDDSPNFNSALSADEAVGINAGTQTLTATNLAKLRRIPLTARVGEDPKSNVAGDGTDEYNESTPFLSYGSQPWDYYMAFEKEACCGYCSTYRKEVPYYDDADKVERNPSCSGTRCDCGSSSSSSSGGGPLVPGGVVTGDAG